MDHEHALVDAGPSRSSPVSQTLSRSHQVPLSPRTSSMNFHSSTGSPPSTPPPRSRKRSAPHIGKGKQPMRGGVDPPVPEHPASDDLRHSHGLSWSSTTRDSVVDNLLSSLDSFSRSDGVAVDTTQDDEERQRYLSSIANQYSLDPTAPRSRGHTYSSSMSESLSTTVSRPNHSRRSGSTTTIGPRHSSIERFQSDRRQDERSMDIREIRNDDSSGVGVLRKGDGGQGGLDYSYSAVLESRRLAWGVRSVSMDQLHEPSTAKSTMLGRGRPVPSVHSKYEASPEPDAAPEPMVAAGPRKMENPMATGPVYLNSTLGNPTSSPLRRPNTQSDLRSGIQMQPLTVPQEIRDQAADFVRTSTMLGSPTLPPPSRAAPEPVKSGTSRRKDPSPTREKPGFFKRVFGGGSSRTASGSTDKPVLQTSQDTNESPNAATRGAPHETTGSQTKPGAAAPTTGATPQPPPSTLNKKPSSFFRRRKKSVSEAPPTPALPLGVIDAHRDAPKSPSVSSLRKVLGPYLDSDGNAIRSAHRSGAEHLARPSSRASDSDDSDDLDIFHAGYTPPPDASLGARHPLSREPSVRRDSNTQRSTKMKIKAKKPKAGREKSSSLAGSSFLHDSSTGPSSVTLGDGEFRPISPVGDITSDDKENRGPDSRPSTGDGIIQSEINKKTGLTRDDANTNGSITKALGAKGSSWFLTPVASREQLQSKRSQHYDEQQKASERGQPYDNKYGSPVLDSKSPTAMAAPNLQSISAEDAEYRERARKIFEGDEEDVLKGGAAAWMGERNPLSTNTLQAYMQLFDFTGLNVVAALRMLCERLVLRGETQQFDRIITALSARWCECNPNHGFKAQDVVHTIIYSLILLNTDLHMADIGEKMSRSAYVKNTLPTIKRVAVDAAPSAFEDNGTVKPNTVLSQRPSIPWMDQGASSPTTLSVPQTGSLKQQSSFDSARTPTLTVNVDINRAPVRPAFGRTDSDGPDSGTGGVSNALVSTPWIGSMRGWETEIEAILKSFFTSIRSDPLPLHSSALSELPAMGDRNMSVMSFNGGLKSSGSIISRTPSEGNMSYRAKYDFRSRWQGRTTRSRPKLYTTSTMGSSRSSFDDGSGFWSPAQNSSKFSLNKTLTSASVGSLGYHHSPATDAYKHSIGFANALSQAIIREEAAGGSDSESFSVPGVLLEDETLELQGAPWAKEGLVKHKHHLEAPDRKAKERNWTDCFAVISKGKLTLFAFNTSSKAHSHRQKPRFHRPGRAASETAARVGGGDWMENAEQLEAFILRQTIASVLPPPGYSTQRPHVWALSLPSGAVHLFQVGTPEIAAEFMTTANYWSARLSKEPLAGGISNIEYGWSEDVINPALVGEPAAAPPKRESVTTPPSSMQTRSKGHAHSMSIERAGGAGRPSLQSSIRNSFDTGLSGVRPRMPADKLHVADWKPPSQSMMASQLMEVDQLKQLQAYVASSEAELARHMELKHAIELAFSPRHPNLLKATTNWQRKSDYLLREIVKYTTYSDSLTAAQKAKAAFYTVKADGESSGRTTALSPVAKIDGDSILEQRPHHPVAA